MLDERRLDAAVRRIAAVCGDRLADRLCWMASYIPICGETSPYLRLVREEYARLRADDS